MPRDISSAGPNPLILTHIFLKSHCVGPSCPLLLGWQFILCMLWEIMDPPLGTIGWVNVVHITELQPDFKYAGQNDPDCRFEGVIWNL